LVSVVTAPADIHAVDPRSNGHARPAVETEVDARHHLAEPAVVVMKFGGTSVADPERLRSIARRLVERRKRGDRVVAVLSAMGSTTDDLLDLARQVSARPDARELDMLISVGERISCALCAMAIHDLGYEAISLTGAQAGIVTDAVHGKAKIMEVRARRVHESLDRGQIVLVAGFQGVSTAQDVTTLGRGGSDTTAVAIAAALGADACEIYSDVEGVYTADPRHVPDARKLHAVSYGEMLEMAASGANVLQLRSVEFARSHGVKIQVRSAFTAEAGTWVVEADDRMIETSMISGVTHTLTEVVFRVTGIKVMELFQALADADVNVDTALRTNGEVVFSAPVDDSGVIRDVLEELGANWSARDDLGKVSLVGAGMRSHPGIAARAFAALAAEDIEPVIIATSPIKIATYLRREDVIAATRALHSAFELDSPDAVRSHD
jgi:aspartate kinase